MSSYPGTNAVLTTVSSPAAPDAYGDPSGADTPVWTGRASGYLKRVRATRPHAGQRIDDTIDLFYLLDADGATIAALTGVTEGWRATIEDQRAPTTITTTFRISKAEHRAANTVVDSQRWELEPDV